MERPSWSGLAEQEKVQAGKPHQRCRENHHVDHEETTERHLSWSRSPFEKARHEITHDRCLVHDLDTYGGRPIGSLIPGKQIAGEAKSHDEAEESQANQPDQFARFFV